MALNPSEARIINPILTNLAQGYSDPEFVGFTLFPPVPVAVAGGQVLEFGKESFRRHSTARAPGTEIKRVTYGYLGKPYALENHAIAGQVPVETQRDAKAVPGIDTAAGAAELAMKIVRRGLEVQQATVATNAANYGNNNKIALTGAGKFSDPASTPILAMDGFREAVRSSCGLYPNAGVFSALAWIAFKNNPSVKATLSDNRSRTVTLADARDLLQIPNLAIGTAVGYVDSADNFNANGDLWGNNIVLGVTALGSKSNAMPSYGYTYTMSGHPAFFNPYYDPGTNSWVYPAVYERIPVLSGIASGFLVQNPA